jgi:hypothetical protein
MKPWEIYIDPKWILGRILKKSTVLDDLTINRVFKLVGKSWPVEYLVFVLGKLNLEVSSRLRIYSSLQETANTRINMNDISFFIEFD